MIHEQRSGQSDGAEPFQNLGEHSRKREQQIQSLGVRISSIYSKNSKFSMAGTECVKWRGLWDEVREKSRSQIMYNLVGCGKNIWILYWVWWEASPVVVHKQKSGRIWFRKIILVVRWTSEYRTTQEQEQGDQLKGYYYRSPGEI